MKILQINVTYKKGSTGNIVANIHKSLLERGYESIVIYGRGKKVHEKGVYKCTYEIESKLFHALCLLTENLYGGMLLSTNKALRIIKKEKPDVVHIHCVNGYSFNIYRLLAFLKKNNIKTVVTNHAEFYYTANCGYSYECDKWKIECNRCPMIKEFNGHLSIDNSKRNFKKMKRAFDGFDIDKLTITSVSPWVTSRSSISHILSQYKNVAVLNGVDTNLFKYHDKEEMRKKHNLPLNKKIFIYVCSLWSEKMKREHFFELANKLKDDLFILVGTPLNMDTPNNVINRGKINNQNELSELYSACDGTLILSKRETFSMPVAESLCSGTPVFGFEAGGPETIAIKEYSKFVPYGDLDNFVSAIEEFKPVDRKMLSNDASNKYSWNKIIEAYIDIYR